MRLRAAALLPLLVLALLASGCSGGGGSDSGGEATMEQAGELEAAQAAAGPEAADGSVDGGDTAEGMGGSRGEPDPSVLPDVTTVAAGDKIIKDGTIELEVAEEEFDAAYARIVRAAESLGGTVVSSETRNAAGEGPSGSVTVRVPVDQYERLLVGVRDFGTIRGRRITSQDVSSEYVDLRARLRQQQAQERFYLGLLEEADDVSDAIAVQQQLQGLQTEIERIKGRLQVLDARTTYSTLTVEIYEPGAPLLTASQPGAPTLAAYWRTAVDGLVNVVGVILVSVVALLPLWLVLGAGVVGWRATRRRPASVAAPTE